MQEHRTAVISGTGEGGVKAMWLSRFPTLQRTTRWGWGEVWERGLGPLHTGSWRGSSVGKVQECGGRCCLYWAWGVQAGPITEAHGQQGAAGRLHVWPAWSGWS